MIKRCHNQKNYKKHPVKMRDLGDGYETKFYDSDKRDDCASHLEFLKQNKQYICPISLEFFVDPVRVKGVEYEKENILQFLQEHDWITPKGQVIDKDDEE